MVEVGGAHRRAAAREAILDRHGRGPRAAVGNRGAGGPDQHAAGAHREGLAAAGGCVRALPGRADLLPSIDVASLMLTTVTAGPYTITGVSVGGVYTSLLVRELDVILDAG